MLEILRFAQNDDGAQNDRGKSGVELIQETSDPECITAQLLYPALNIDEKVICEVEQIVFPNVNP